MREGIILDKLIEITKRNIGNEKKGILKEEYKLLKDLDLTEDSSGSEVEIYVLTKDLYNETIVIDEENIIIDGNGFSIKNEDGIPPIIINEGVKNITIKNLKLEGNSIGILSSGENIKIKDVVFVKNLIGIIANRGRHIYVENSIFIENLIGVAFLTFVSSSKINNNDFLNNTASIIFYENCSYNHILANKFTNNIVRLEEYGILFGEDNSFNEISKNDIDFSKNEVMCTFFIKEYTSVGVSIFGKNNIMNKLSENNISYEENCLKIDGYGEGSIRVNNIYIDKSNSNEMCKNKLSIKENEFIISGESIKVDISNIYLKEESNDSKIYNNKINICKNTIKPFGYSNEINVENIVLHFNISNTLIKNNTLNLYLNLTCIKDVSSIKLSEYRNNIRLYENNSSNTIIANILYIEKNGVCRGNGVLLYLRNNSNEITENYFKKVSHFAINFESENNSNFISRNKIRDTKGSGILFLGRALKGNDSNIITCNDISSSRANGILFLENNKQNSISNNHINSNCLNGILFKEEGNIFNYIFNNSFKWNGEDISIGLNEPNYIENNLLKELK